MTFAVDEEARGRGQVWYTHARTLAKTPGQFVTTSLPCKSDSPNEELLGGVPRSFTAPSPSSGQCRGTANGSRCNHHHVLVQGPRGPIRPSTTPPLSPRRLGELVWPFYVVIDVGKDGLPPSFLCSPRDCIGVDAGVNSGPRPRRYFVITWKLECLVRGGARVCAVTRRGALTAFLVLRAAAADGQTAASRPRRSNGAHLCRACACVCARFE